MSLKQIVGQKTYSVWVEMLRQLVPDGRTHRLAPLIAGMLQCAADRAYQQYGGQPPEGSTAQILTAEVYDPTEAAELRALVDQLFADAKVESDRVNARGAGYSIAEQAIYNFIHWYDMPWEA